MTAEWILETRGLTREFKGFVAVDGVDLKVRRGEIHALIGPNGAGKTTVFNLLTRFLDVSSGSIEFEGENITKQKPAQVADRGVIRSFQISAVFPHMTVLENVRIALQSKLNVTYRFWRSDRMLERFNERALALLESVGLARYAYTVTSELAYGRKRALEIATTLAMDPKLMLLDEPTQGMGSEDVGRTAELIRAAAKDRTVLMVEHNLGVVADLADTITVLQRGTILAEGSYAQVSSNPQVMEAYMGVANG